MTQSELDRLEMLAEVDELTTGVARWADCESAWEPAHRAAALLKRVLGRVESLRVRLEAPLVVATFGGTGTGKSSLVNALVGDDVAVSGRQRPTTRQPVLIAHPQTDLELLGLPQDMCEVVRNDSDLLRDTVIIDCPDPDTTDNNDASSNLERLRKILPYCDVLMYASTQQKYRSARVVDELAEAATGCRLVFVQTHADRDEDIREDWREHLSGKYEVPDVFFVDSLKALEEQRQGQRPTGDMGRLLDFLSRQLSSSERVSVRRANVVDLLNAGLERCVGLVDEHWPKLHDLQQALVEQRESLRRKMAANLKRELMVSRNLWERRLLTAVTATWGFSPFSSVLRLYNGLGALLASFTLFRARSSAQMALLGAVQGYRWLEGRNEEKTAESSLERASALGLDDALLRESQLIITGHVKAADLHPALAVPKNLREMRGQAAAVERDFLGDAAGRVDGVINELAVRNSGWFVRGLYELLFLSYVIYVLFRIGKNFFYESFLEQEAILSTDFYIPATVFLVLWTGLLVTAFTHRLRKGLSRRIEELSQELVNRQMDQTLFPDLQQACDAANQDRLRLHQLTQRSMQLRHSVATSSALGGVKPVRPVESPAVTAPQ